MYVYSVCRLGFDPCGSSPYVCERFSVPLFVVNRFLLWRLETETPAREGACSAELLDYTYVTLERGAPSGNSFPVQQRAGSTDGGNSAREGASS